MRMVWHIWFFVIVACVGGSVYCPSEFSYKLHSKDSVSYMKILMDSKHFPRVKLRFVIVKIWRVSLIYIC